MDDKTTEFVEGLTALSQKTGIGIAGTPVLFLMETDDYERIYKTDEESQLTFE